MAAFIETPRFPDDISYWAKGGPNYHTTIAELFSGLEQRNVDWNLARCSYDLSQVLRRADGPNPNFTTYAASTIIAWHRAMKGRAYGFRFKDWADFATTQNGTVAGSTGLLGTTGLGLGIAAYQLYKQYLTGANSDLRKILKPVSGQVSVFRGGVAVTVGAGSGQIAIDTTTGIITFVPDATANATAITPGATTVVTCATNPGTLAGGGLLYLSGFTGTDAGLVNGIAHTINSVSGGGPFTFTLATNTAGKTITLGSGLLSAFPQPAEILTWSGQFDVPVRFDTDNFVGGFESSGAYFQIDKLPLIELLS